MTKTNKEILGMDEFWLRKAYLLARVALETLARVRRYLHLASGVP
jgi:hypothetical protein